MDNYKKIYKKNTKKALDIINNLEKKINSEKYYELSKVLKNIKLFLFDFIRLYDSMRKIEDFKFLLYDNKKYKFIYDYQIVQYMKLDKTTISKKINILVSLGLIDKLNIYNKDVLHHPIIKKTLEISKNTKKRNVNFYCIPSYTNHLLNSANDKAIEFLKNAFSIRSFNKSFVIKTLGQEYADKVFLDRRTIPKIHYQQIEEIESSIITYLYYNDYIKLKNFKQKILSKYTKENKSFKATAIYTNINSAIDNLIKEKIIVKRKLNKNEKEKYNLSIQEKFDYILKGERYEKFNNCKYIT